MKEVDRYLEMVWMLCRSPVRSDSDTPISGSTVSSVPGTL